MKIGRLVCFLLLTGAISCMYVKKEVPNEIIACGGHDIIIFDEAQSYGESLRITWRWNIEEATELPAEYQKYLNPLDECKPVDENRKILATSSGGGVVLLDRATKDILFYANAPMAHSAEYLPGDRIVVALSDHPYGNSIELFDVATPEKCIYRDPLQWGHGVVWMPKQDRLYALGSDDLVCYSLKNWDTGQPGLNREKTWKLPEWGGHDLISISDNELVVTVAESVWTFYIDGEEFEPFEPLNAVDVKSVNYNKATGKLVYTKAEVEWWTHNIYSENPNKKYTISDVNIYKARVYPQ
jgi:hypothetical protein